MKLKIFISAYACEPNLGSEIGVGWHWVLEMSKYFELWVLTRKSNQHTIEPWIADHPQYNHIHFIYFDLPKWARFWKKGLRGVRVYYNIWQWKSNKIVKHIMRDNGIEIFHHLTYGNFLWPVSNYGQKQFFVWGPGSSGSVVPKEFSNKYCFKGRAKEILQRLVRNTLKYNGGYKKRCRNSNLILCKTTDAYECIPVKESVKAILFTDVAVEIKDIPDLKKNDNTGKNLKYLSVGTLDGWRGFDILIEAFSLALKSYPDMELEILGEGCEWSNLEQLIEKLKIKNQVRLLGKVSMATYYEKMAQADVIVNPCLREGAVTVSFDSMTFGKPLLCIDTGGYTRYFNNDYAVVINLSTRQDTIHSMAEGIIKLTDPGIRNYKGTKAKEASLQYSWTHKGRLIYETINTAYSEWIETSITT